MSKTGSQHYEMCLLGAKWMTKQHYYSFKYVAVELVSMSPEQPDVWGTNGSYSMLIEVKTSRADFLNDMKKKVRNGALQRFALGNYRYYLVPEGMVKAAELPEKWGLLEWDGKEIKVTVKAELQKCENRGELMLLCSIMRREGIKKQIFNYRGGKKNEG